MDTGFNFDCLATVARLLPSKIILLKHDEKGNIKDIYSNPYLEQYSSIIRQLKRIGTLAPFFNLSKLIDENDYSTFAEATDSTLVLPYFPFYTSLPRYTLATQRIKDNLFLSRLLQIELQPMVASPSLNTYAFFNMKQDLLVGFTPEFYSHFNEIFPDPLSMLNISASKLLSPSPVKFQSAMNQFSNLVQEGDVIYDKDFSCQNLDSIEETTPRILAQHIGALVWDNTNSAQAFLTILKEIDGTCNDFTASFSFESSVNNYPYFIFGGRYIDEYNLPDNAGYMAGRTIHENHVVIKRNGFSTLHEKAASLPGKATTVHFCKTGHSIQLFEENNIIASYYDSDFLPLRQGYVSMCLRNGGHCIIKRITIKIRKSASIEPMRQVSRLLNNRENYFTLDRFYNIALCQPYLLDVGGFFLSDVTEMKMQVHELTGKYQSKLRQEKKLRSLLKNTTIDSLPLFWKSPPMKAIKDSAIYAAESDATVLIEGSTGVGKEVLARHIHYQSKRKDGPLVKVDCATIPSTLIESRLFGHEKGAFTGANARVVGLFETADSGSIFLDEVGNLTPEVQMKLLQFLNDFSITRIGGTVPIQLNVRLIAATNANLQTLVHEGKFREDLYYRLHVIYIRMPSLKERREDIPELANYFLKTYSTEQAKNINGFTNKAIEKLASHSWPGNIRELSNVVQRAVIFSSDNIIDAPLINFLNLSNNEEGYVTRKRSHLLLEHTTTKTVLSALKKNNGRVRETANDLGMAWPTLYKYLRDHNIKARKFQKGFGKI